LSTVLGRRRTYVAWLDHFARLVRVIEHNASTPGAVGLYSMLSIEASDPTHPHTATSQTVTPGCDETSGRPWTRLPDAD